MKSIEYLPSAIADLDSIYYQIGQEDVDAADRMINRIYGSAHRLVDFPKSAPVRPDIGKGVRSLVVGRYLLLYRVEADRVDVVRVVHGSRDVAALLDD